MGLAIVWFVILVALMALVLRVNSRLFKSTLETAIVLFLTSVVAYPLAVVALAASETILIAGGLFAACAAAAFVLNRLVGRA